LICANSNGIILPKYVLGEEVESLKALGDINITVAQSRRTAYGNLVLANNHGAVADPRLKREELSMVRETLGVEVAQGQVAGLPYVGSLGVATDKGVMAHPLIKPEEKALLEEMLRVPVEAGTINCGIPYIATGLIGNSKVSVAGSETTGPELAMISDALGVG
jgi:translation initiation factor 6